MEIYETTAEYNRWGETEKKGASVLLAGPWGARVLLAQKKDRTWRFCVDYRLLNALTVNIVYNAEHRRNIGAVAWR
jgi:hypothetical protein